MFVSLLWFVRPISSYWKLDDLAKFLSYRNFRLNCIRGNAVIQWALPRDYQGKRVNPHIGPLIKVIRLKLFLDIVPSSSGDITRAMRGQPKRLSRIT